MNQLLLYIQFNSQINAADRQNNEYNIHKGTKNREKIEIKTVKQLKTNPGDRHQTCGQSVAIQIL